MDNINLVMAYLDPGSASALLAGILAGVAGISAGIKMWFSKVFKRNKGDMETLPEADETGELNTVNNENQ